MLVCIEMDPSLLMSVLAQGHEQTRQLKAQLDEPLDVESCKMLVRKAQSSFETAIAMAKHLGGGCSDSPQSGSESPGSENLEHQGLKNEEERREMMCKKRKSMPKWSSQVKVGLGGGGIEWPLDDGHNWRKYGQKDILGAKYPRGYYRCTHRNSQGCLATKQVQRSDDNPSIFDVSYRGVHTCIEKYQKVQASSKEPNMKLSQYSPPVQDQDPQLLMSLRASLKVKTEGLKSEGGQAYVTNSSSFSFPSTPASCMQSQSNIFSSPTMHENHFSSTFSPNFLSSTTAESNYFSVSQCQTSNYGAGPDVHNSETELTEIISAATSATNSQMVDVDFALGPGVFDSSFLFDGSNFW